MIKIFKYPEVIVNGIAAYDRYFQAKECFSWYITSVKNFSVGIPVKFIRKDFGGSGANIAYSLKKNGIEPMLVCYTGLGFEDYKKRLEKNNISYYFIEDKNYFSSGCVIYSDARDNKISFFDNGALESKKKIDREAFDHSIDFSKVKFAIIAPNLPKNSLDFYDLLEKRNIDHVFDPGAKILDFNLGQFKKIDRSSFVTILNDQEMANFEKFHKVGLKKISLAKYLIVTRGAHGLDVYQKGKLILHKDIVKTAKIVNTAGCGDALRGGFVGDLAKGRYLDEALNTGLRMASLKASTIGTQNF